MVIAQLLVRGVCGENKHQPWLHSVRSLLYCSSLKLTLDFTTSQVPSCRQGLLGSLTHAPRESWQEGDKLCTEQEQPEGTATGILLICKSPRFA